MTISTFTLIKNEIEFIIYNILSVIDYIDEMIFLDGNSTDGTLEAIEYIQNNHKNGSKIKLFKDMDCRDLKDHYTSLFNEAIKLCKGKYVWYLHPDMIVLNPEKILDIGKDDALAYYVNIKSFSHDGKVEITKGRYNWWKTICKNDFGLYYHGYYGAEDEDMYFKEITGDNHVLYTEPGMYPYEVKNSGLNINHYCECKDYNRRFEKMVKCLMTLFPKATKSEAEMLAKVHPRVTLETGDSGFGLFEFRKTDEPLPPIFNDNFAKKIKERICLNKV